MATGVFRRPPRPPQRRRWVGTKAAAGGGSITVSGVGAIASAEAFGTPEANRWVGPAGVASAEAFGSAHAKRHLGPAGIATAEAHGVTEANRRLGPAGIASAEAFGPPTGIQTPGLTPVLISGDGAGAGTSTEKTVYVGPVIDGNGNLYTLTEDDDGTFQAQIRKSTDGGDTWTEPAGKLASSTDCEGFQFVHVPADCEIHMLRQRSSGTVVYFRYRTSDHPTNPDTWGQTPVTVHSPGVAAAAESVALLRRSNGHLIAIYRTDPSGGDERIGWRKSTNNGTSWGSETVITETGKDLTQIVAVVGESDKIHIFTANETDASVGHRSLDSGDTLSSVEVVNDNAVETMSSPGESGPMATRAIYIDDSGTERIYVAWRRASDGLLAGAFVVDDATPSAEETISDRAVYNEPPNMQSFQTVACLAADGSTIYAVYADDSTHDLWVATRSGGAWGTDVELIDATDVIQLSANVLTHSAGNGGQKVLAVVIAVDSGVEDADRVYYTEGVIPSSATKVRRVVGPGGVASAEAVGRPSLPDFVGDTITVSGVGAIASAEAFGTPEANRWLGPGGIASNETFGTPQVVRQVRNAGAIATAEAFGTPEAERWVGPGGVASQEAFGVTKLRRVVGPGGIASAEAFGRPSLPDFATGAIQITGVGAIASLEAFGTPHCKGRLGPGGIASELAFGTPAGLRVVRNAGAISTAEAFGNPKARRVLAAIGIESAELVATPALKRYVRQAGGIASLEAVGRPLVGGDEVLDLRIPGQVRLWNAEVGSVGLTDSGVGGVLVNADPVGHVGLSDREG